MTDHYEREVQLQAVITEQIEWITVDEALPDDSETVLMDFENAEPWLGYHDGGTWYAVDGIAVDRVIAWARAPEGTAPLPKEKMT